MGRHLSILDHRGNPIPATALGSTFEGASTGRRLHTWGISTAGPTQALFGSLSTLRSRSRQLSRNEPQIDGGIDTLVANMVGNGITPRWQLEDSALKKDIQQLWSDWTKEADADGIADFYGLQALAARSMVEAGEVLNRFRPRRLSDGLSVPLQLQLLEPDHLDESYSTTNPRTGNEIRFGIELDRIGRRVAYHLFKEHPGELFLGADNVTRVPVPAAEMLHVYRPLRPGQKRGRPWLASVIVAMHELAQYDDAELVRKKAAAMFGGFITEPAGADPNYNPLGPREEEDDIDIVAFEPGTYVKLPAGYDVENSSPADVGGNYEAFTKRNERRIARGFGGLTYEKFTGDLTDVNYSSIRAGNLEFQRLMMMIIGNVLAFQYCQPIAAYWLRQAVLAGALRIRDFAADPRKYLRIKWCIDGWPWVDPEKDQKAERSAIRSGLKSRSESVAERGRDVEEVDDEIAQDNERADRRSLILDSDPRYTAQNGAARDRNGGAKEEETD